MALYIAPAALGLGDLVVTLPVVQELVARGESVYLVLRAEEHVELARRVPGLAGTRLEWELPECLSEADRFIDLRDHPLERVAWWGSQPWLDAYPGWTIDDILRTICGDKSIAVDFSAPYRPLKFVRRKELADKVLLIPGSAVSAKMWSVEHWLGLASAVDAVVIGRVDDVNVLDDAAVNVVQALAPTVWYPTPTIADALDAVSSCRAVVSVDTGIMHMAVHQGTPTVGIYRSSPVYVRERENFIAVSAANACSQICYDREVSKSHHGRPEAGRDFHPNDWSCVAPRDAQCMETISVEEVLKALESVTSPRREIAV